jgi:hypothetical protein
MGSYRKERPAAGNCGPFGWFPSDDSSNTIPNAKEEQLGALRGLGELRRALDAWHQTGADGDLPQPADFGLRLGPLSSAEVWWRPT